MDSGYLARRAMGCALLVGLALLARGPAAADPQRRCEQDAMEDWYCAVDAKGVAVLDKMGKVVCSPGLCVESEGEWQCSAVPGGSAELSPVVPVCEGGCRTPSTLDCERTLGPASWVPEPGVDAAAAGWSALASLPMLAARDGRVGPREVCTRVK